MLSDLCNDIYKLFLLGTKGMNPELFYKAHELCRYFLENPATPESVEPVLELERKLAAVKGPHKQFVEEEVFQALSLAALHCEPNDSSTKRMTLAPALLKRPASIQEKQQILLAMRLVDFSKELLQVQNPKDAFNNKRKALAMELLGRVAAYYDMPEAVELCMAALHSNKRTLVLAAIEFFEDYTCDRQLALPPDMIRRLDEIVHETDDRSVAVAALNLEVEAGVTSELGALSRLDDWKEKNLYGR